MRKLRATTDPIVVIISIVIDVIIIHIVITIVIIIVIIQDQGDYRLE